MQLICLNLYIFRKYSTKTITGELEALQDVSKKQTRNHNPIPSRCFSHNENKKYLQ